LFFRLADGNAAVIEKLKRMEEIEFFNLFEQYERKLELENKQRHGG
jgi:hypothetical protein